jgi:hypothetical protein
MRIFWRLSKAAAAGSLLLAGVLVASVQPAAAASYHFVGSKSCVQSGDSVTCSFSVAGLGNASTATAEITSAFQCVKFAAGKNYTAPGGLASSGAQQFPVTNGRVNVTDLQLTANSCPDHFSPQFTGPVSVYINGVLVGTIPIRT